MKAVIIDDSEKARIALKSDLATYCPEIEVAGEASGVFAGLDLIEKLRPTLLLLDIRMADGSGFDLLEHLKVRGVTGFNVIFTTAYNEYAIRAFKFSATDYLLKPVDPEELKEAIARVQQNRRLPADNAMQLHFLLDSYRDLTAGSRRIALSGTDKIQIVAIEEIVRCESQGNYTQFSLTEGRKTLVTKTLKEFEGLLAGSGFLRVHHSHLINLKHLKEYVKSDGGYAVMRDGSHVPVSVRKKEELFKILFPQ